MPAPRSPPNLSYLTAPGVTIVQYRDKTSDTGALIATARKLHAITRAHGVPLLINDRVDVAVAAEVEGVHLGQDDMSMRSGMLDTNIEL